MTARLAHALIGAHRTGRRVAPAPADLPRTAEDAYAVQQAVSARFGAIGGFKTGRQGDDPRIIAPIRADRCVASGAAVPARDRLGIELEIGFRVLAALPPGAGADLTQVLQPVAVIELVDTRVAGPFAADPLVRLADAQINAGLVVGQVQDGWDGGDFTAVTATLRCGDRMLLDGPVPVPGGSALAAVRAAARLVAGRYGPLVPGQIVITGALHPLAWVAPGTPVAARIAGLGAVAVTVTAA